MQFRNLRQLLLAVVALQMLPVASMAQSVQTFPKSIHIIVATDYHIELGRLGALVFWNKRARLPVDQPEVQDILLRTLINELEQEGRYKVTGEVVSKEAYSDYLASLQRARQPAFLTSFSFKEAPTQWAKAASQCNCEQLLVIHPSPLMTGTNQNYDYLTWFARSAGEKGEQTSFNLSLFYALIDAKTFQIIKTDTRSSRTKLTDKLWPTETLQLTDEQRTHFLSNVEPNSKQMARELLFDFGLRPSCAEALPRYKNISPDPSRGIPGGPQRLPVVFPEGASADKCP